MPANKKYLSSNWQRFAKITSGFIGGYLVTMTSHIALAFWFNHKNIIITTAFTGFILWATLMVLAFLAKNGWKIWLVYLGMSLLFAVLVYLGMLYQPIA